jgi:transcriptional regulator GlxA family with amidase domain
VDTLQQWIKLHPDDWAQDSKLRNKARAFLETNSAYSAQFEPLAQQVSQTKRQFVRLFNAWEIDRTRKSISIILMQSTKILEIVRVNLIN